MKKQLLLASLIMLMSLTNAIAAENIEYDKDTQTISALHNSNVSFTNVTNDTLVTPPLRYKAIITYTFTTKLDILWFNPISFFKQIREGIKNKIYNPYIRTMPAPCPLVYSSIHR